MLAQTSEPCRGHNETVESVVRHAFEAAEQFRHTFVGSDHLFAAITRGGADSRGRAALAACGVDETLADKFLANMTVEPPMPPLNKGERPEPNPKFYWVLGRAQGFAYAGGSERVGSEHVLLALIWDDSRLTTYVLDAVGRTPSDLVAALAELGVKTPDQSPPVE